MANGVIQLKILRGGLVLDYQVGPEGNHMYLYKIDTESRRDTEGLCEDGGRDWTYAAKSQGWPEATGRGTEQILP